MHYTDLISMASLTEIPPASHDIRMESFKQKGCKAALMAPPSKEHMSILAQFHQHPTINGHHWPAFSKPLERCHAIRQSHYPKLYQAHIDIHRIDDITRAQCPQGQSLAAKTMIELHYIKLEYQYLDMQLAIYDHHHIEADTCILKRYYCWQQGVFNMLDHIHSLLKQDKTYLGLYEACELCLPLYVDEATLAATQVYLQQQSSNTEALITKWTDARL